MKNYFIRFFVLVFALLSVIVFSCKHTTPAAPLATPVAPLATATVAYTATITQTMTISPTFTITNTPTRIVNVNFSSNLSGWTIDSALTGGTSVTWTNISPYGALGTTGCAKVACSFTGTGGYAGATSSMAFTHTFASPVDVLTKGFQFYIYVPSTLSSLTVKYGLQMEVMTASSPGVWHGVAAWNLSTSDWNWLYFSPPMPAGSDQTTAVRIIVYKPATSVDWAGDIYIDEILW